MKKILIIGSNRLSKKNNPTDIAQAFKASPTISESLWYWEDIVFDVTSGNVRVTHKGQDFKDLNPELVICVGWYKNGSQSIYRDVAYSLAMYLNHHDIPFWNSEMALQRSTTKFSCMVQLALAGESVPRTIFSLQKANMNRCLDLPYIVKAVAASRGNSNHLVTTASQVDELVKDDVYYLAQPYLENDHDLRVICFDGKPKMVLKRSRSANAETHMNNTSQGGSAVWLEMNEIPETVLEAAGRICHIMKREMAGIDFIPDSSSKTGYACLEVNAIPQLTSGFDSQKKLDALVQAISEKDD